MTEETKRKLKAESMRKYRTLKRIYNIVKDKTATTLTFTFNDETLQNTNKQTRLQYIKRYLNDFASDYVLNIDYGALNEREHYHAIATPKYKIFLFNRYKYGNIQAVKIHTNKQYKNINKSDEEIAKRFYNHATKQTTKNEKLIFARPNKNESKYKNQIDSFLNGNKTTTDKEYYDFINEELNEIYGGKTADDDQQEEIIKHPKGFYYKYDESMIFRPLKIIDEKSILYTATKYDKTNGKYIQRTIIYDEKSEIYKTYVNQIKNDLIIFTF